MSNGQMPPVRNPAQPPVAPTGASASLAQLDRIEAELRRHGELLDGLAQAHAALLAALVDETEPADDEPERTLDGDVLGGPRDQGSPL